MNGINFNQSEKEVWNNILSTGRGLACRNKAQIISDYPNLLSNELVYIDQWGKKAAPNLKLTLKGESFLNHKI